MKVKMGELKVVVKDGADTELDRWKIIESDCKFLQVKVNEMASVASRGLGFQIVEEIAEDSDMEGV